MTASNLLFVLLVLACPLMMILMMRGGHGHGGHSHGHRTHDVSMEELRRRRGELDRVIEERERSNGELRGTSK